MSLFYVLVNYQVEKHTTEQELLNRYQELEEQREMERYANPGSSRSNRFASRQKQQRRNMRLPHVLFAASLEEVLIIAIVYSISISYACLSY